MKLPQKLSSAQAYVTKEIWNDLIDYIRSLQIVPSVNIMPRVTSQGTYLVGYAASKNASIPEEMFPWKIVNMQGVGQPDQDGNFNSYEFSVWPAVINGIMPPNMISSGELAKFTASTSSPQNVVLKCKSDGKDIISATIEVTASLPTPKAAEKFNLPKELDILLAVVYKSFIYQIENESLTAQPYLVGITTKSSGSYPYELWLNWSYHNEAFGGSGGGGGGGFPTY